MKYLFILGLVVFVGAVALIFKKYDDLNVERKGEVVKMRIESLPKSCVGARVRYFVIYSYNGQMFEKATRGDFCERHHVGELIDMKFLKNSETILRPDESVVMNIVSFGILAFLGIGISISQWKKMQSFAK